MTFPWTAQLNLGKNIDVNNVKPYHPTTIARKSAITWNTGNTWIMKVFQLGLHPKQTYDQFMADEFFNVYDKTGPPGMSNSKP